jgi:2-amino-4-hydroxy-6-hydroxymethyldihydropteridine diphosphokinase
MADINVFAFSPPITSAPLGPSRRRYANAAAILATSLHPDELIARLHSIETHFGRDRRGQKWRARVLDIDILLWSGGIWVSRHPLLAVPHRSMRDRAFVLMPAMAIAPDWRDPLTGLTIRQLFHRLTRPKPLDRRQAAH